MQSNVEYAKLQKRSWHSRGGSGEEGKEASHSLLGSKPPPTSNFISNSLQPPTNGLH